ncbi:MAG: hypothetical protein IT200_06680 [Thermoleophilia bacterium]|nr:hypothetical protein [Thermoleophilia bacterium]
MPQHTGRRGLLITVAVALAAIAWLAARPAPSVAHGGHGHPAARWSGAQTDDLQRARAATRAFRDIDVARAAGYTETSGKCEQDPKYGGLGIHYANPELLADGTLDVTKPEVLVYHPTRGGKLRLGAVEYFQADADQDLATDPDRPYLFDLPFDGPMLGHEPGMPIHYDLHVWLYRHNPAGLFAAWNPRVHCPDATSQAARRVVNR